jgi:hypothetical protein
MSFVRYLSMLLWFLLPAKDHFPLSHKTEKVDALIKESPHYFLSELILHPTRPNDNSNIIRTLFVGYSKLIRIYRNDERIITELSTKYIRAG